jgi:hypothetical protein
MDEHDRIALQLVQDASSPDERRRLEALEELRSLVGLFPTELSYRIYLAMALALGRLCEEAITQAQMLEELDTGTHEFEFTLAEVYLICGDLSLARSHALEAQRLARSEEDHQDAREILRRINVRTAGGRKTGRWPRSGA